MRMLAGGLASEQFIQFAALIERTYLVKSADMDVTDKNLRNRTATAAALLHFVETSRVP